MSRPPFCAKGATQGERDDNERKEVNRSVGPSILACDDPPSPRGYGGAGDVIGVNDVSGIFGTTVGHVGLQHDANCREVSGNG